MAKTKEARLKVTLKDKTKKGFASLGGSLKKFTKAVLSSKLGIAALAAALGFAIKDFAKFESKMVDVGNLFRATTEEVKALSKGVIDISTRIPQSAQILAESLFDVVSAGVAVGDSLKFLEESSKLAVAGVTDTKTAVDGLTSVMNAFGVEFDKANEISDKFFAAQVEGKTTIAELAASIGDIAPIASAAGLSIDEMFASISALTKQGIKTNTAVIQVRQVIASIIKPTSEAIDVAKKLGFEFNSEALAAKGLAGFLSDVQKKTGGNIEITGKLFGNIRALNGVLALSKDNFRDLRDIQESVSNSLGETEVAFKKQSDTISAQSKLALNNVLALSKSLISVLAPAIKGVLRGFNNFFKNAAAGFDKLLGRSEKQLTAELERLEKFLESSASADSRVRQLSEDRLQFLREKLGLEEEAEQESIERRVTIRQEAQVVENEKKQGNVLKELELAEKSADDIVGISSSLSDAIISNESNKAKAVGEVLKKSLKRQIDVTAAVEIKKAVIESFGSFGTSLLRIPLIIAAQTAGKAAIGAISFHEGGVVGQTATQSAPGLGSNEVGAVLEKGERVLTQQTDQELNRLLVGLNKTLNTMNSQPTIIQIDGMEVARATAPHLVSFQRLNQAGSV